MTFVTGTGARGADQPLVGRAAEVSSLVDTLTGSLDGTAAGVLLAGDAGVGKTRLLTDIIRLARDDGFTVLTGHCVDIGEVGLPYLPFGEIVSTVAADPELDEILQRHPEATRVLRTDSSSAPERGAEARLALFAAVADLLTDLAALRPLLVVVEDIHWADQSTRELLHFLLTRLHQQRLTIIASYRSDDLHRRHPLRPLLAELVRLPGVVRRQLDPLPDGDVVRLLRSSGREIPESTLRGILARAEGNAFYAEELLAATVDADGSAPDALVPGGLADVLLTRLEQLPTTAQRVVRLASVAGRRVEHDLLRQAADMPEDDLDTALREAVGRHLLVSEDGATYSFRHALLREATYADLLPGERVRMHATFARLLSEPGRGLEHAAARAHHFRASHDLPGALRASVEAADQAAQMGAPAEELRHLENVLEMWAAVPDAAQIVGHSDIPVMLRASTAAVQAGEPTRAVSLTRGALDRVGPHVDAELAARVRYTLAKNLMSIDREEAAYRESSAALELIPADPPSMTWVWAATTHVLTSFYVGDNDGARAIGERALAAAEELGADDAAADLLVTMVGLTEPGRASSGGRAQLMRARDLAERSGNVPVELRAYFNLAIAAYESGGLADALQWAGDGARRAKRTGLGLDTYGVELRFIEALATYALGRWDECLTVIEEVEAAGGSDWTVHISSVGLGVVAGRGTRDVVALITDRFGAPTLHPVVVVNDASAAIDQAMWNADAAAALEWFDRASTAMLERFPDLGLAVLRLCGLALGALADEVQRARLVGDTAAVERWTAAAGRVMHTATDADVDSSQHPDSAIGPEALAWMRRCEAEFARVEESDDLVERWRADVDGFGWGHVYETARSRWRLADALLSVGEREEAATQSELARTVAVELGAEPLRNAVESLRRRGHLGADGARAGDGNLTPRERDVLALVVRGRTNRQIGSALFISDKTASVHVSNILAKLGASSRTEAAAIAHRTGLVD